jgi:hypothetical protein
MRVRCAHGTHLTESDVQVALRELPRGFGTRKASADYCDARVQVLF